MAFALNLAIYQTGSYYLAPRLPTVSSWDIKNLPDNTKLLKTASKRFLYTISFS
jgi:hypothetical protein